MPSLLKQAALLFTSAAALLPAALPALAAPPPDVFRDASGNVYVHGATATALASSANARIQTSEPLTRSLRAGYCGEIRLSESTSLPSIGNSWTIGGTTYQRTSMTTFSNPDLLPRCRSNVFTPAASGHFVDATTDTDRVTITGLTPGMSYEVSFNNVYASQNARANACGFFRFSSSQANPLPASLTINGTAYTVSSLPTANPPLCQRDSSGSYVRYVPTTW